MTTDFSSESLGVAILRFPITLGHLDYCLSFWYQMRGKEVGKYFFYVFMYFLCSTDPLVLVTFSLLA